MLLYFFRRILYLIPILVGVNLLVFAMFFVVNTPDDMARQALGEKADRPEAIEVWKANHGYDMPFSSTVRLRAWASSPIRFSFVGALACSGVTLACPTQRARR